MCPVEWYLARTTLMYPTGKFINHPGINQLPNDPSVGAFLMQDNHGVKSGDLSSAVAYVHAQWKPDDQTTDIQFWFFYAYNDPGTYRIGNLITGNSEDAVLDPMGEHWGDWEYCTLRVDNSTKDLRAIIVSQYGDGEYWDQSQFQSGQVTFTNGQHPNIYASKNGHANYVSVGDNLTSHKTLRPFLDFNLCNFTDGGGAVLDCSQRHQIVKVDWLSNKKGDPVVSALSGSLTSIRYF